MDPHRPQAFHVETEATGQDRVVNVATVFLVGRECPWRCLMCDLWKHTLKTTTPSGAIPAQIAAAFRELRLVRERGRWSCPGGNGGAPRLVSHLKLYNSGSFFDARAVPPDDHPAIAEWAGGFERLIVECHPSLVGRRCLQFAERLEAASKDGPPPQLEVAMGLETSHPAVLAKLNKGLTLDGFRRASGFLRRHGFPLRVFVLVKPPFLDHDDAREWAELSVAFAFDSGAETVSLIPTRGGNGAMESLAARGRFAPPRLAALESVMVHALQLRRGRVLVDLWDLERLRECGACFGARRDRLHRMNLEQRAAPSVACAACGGV
jgi:radical SAM enzyme (TIGR01210 family)